MPELQTPSHGQFPAYVETIDGTTWPSQRGPRPVALLARPTPGVSTPIHHSLSFHPRPRASVSETGGDSHSSPTTPVHRPRPACLLSTPAVGLGRLPVWRGHLRLTLGWVLRQPSPRLGWRLCPGVRVSPAVQVSVNRAAPRVLRSTRGRHGRLEGVVACVARGIDTRFLGWLDSRPPGTRPGSQRLWCSLFRGLAVSSSSSLQRHRPFSQHRRDPGVSRGSCWCWLWV